MKSLVVLNEYGFPKGYNPDAWRYTEWRTNFYIAIYGRKERLETLCDYVAISPILKATCARNSFGPSLCARARHT